MERFRKLISMTTKFLRALLPIDNQSTQKVKYETLAFYVDFLIYVLWKETLIDLYPIEEVIESKLFGDGTENEVFRDILGDYLAIGKTNKTILYQGNSELLSQHAGYTDDEIYIPLIVINR